MEGSGFNMLPEGCVSTILSLTSPPDACKLSLVSPMFRAAAESDVVWERLLPAGYQEILRTLVNPLVFSSRKELFLGLCHPNLIDGGRKVGFTPPFSCFSPYHSFFNYSLFVYKLAELEIRQMEWKSILYTVCKRVVHHMEP